MDRWIDSQNNRQTDRLLLLGNQSSMKGAGSRHKQAHAIAGFARREDRETNSDRQTDTQITD